MKLTKQQISELTDTQLNRAVVWCYPPEHREADPFEDDGRVCWSGSYEDTICYEYLQDWNLLMPMVVDSEFEYSRNSWGEFEVEVPDGAVYSINKSLQRAYCEALVYLKVGV